VRPREIYWGAVPSPHTVGHEQHDGPKGVGEPVRPRPYLILSSRGMNRSQVVIAAPITSKVERADAHEPERVNIDPGDVVQAPGDTGTSVPGVVLLGHLRVMSVARFSGRHGTLNLHRWSEVQVALVNLFGLSPSAGR